MDNKQIKRLFHIAISALKKIKQDNEKQGAMGWGEWRELWTGQEGSLWRGNSVGETKMIGTSYEGHCLPSNITFNSVCSLVTHTDSPHRSTSPWGQRLFQTVSLYHNPNKREQRVGWCYALKEQIMVSWMCVHMDERMNTWIKKSWYLAALQIGNRIIQNLFYSYK